MSDWLRADMDADDSGSQGYTPPYERPPIEHQIGPAEWWDECPVCGDELETRPSGDEGPDRVLACRNCDYHWSD